MDGWTEGESRPGSNLRCSGSELGFALELHARSMVQAPGAVTGSV